MRSIIRPAALLAALTLSALPATAQQAGGIAADLLRDIDQAQKKLLALAGAMSDSAWNWRPASGVRSTGEVFQHIAADNYLIPGAMGAAVPAETGIKPDDYTTAQKYESRKIDRAAAIADLEKSFAFLRQALTGTAVEAMDEKVTVFGQSFTRQQMWIMGTTHLHEHLGQLIAYARSNGIVPPWSRAG
jgi:uncharacterized damage-inducible protein DinB